MKNVVIKLGVAAAFLSALFYGLWLNRELPRKKYPAGPVVFILAGNVRPDVLGCYRTDGYSDTPHLDLFAKDAIRFTNVRASEKTLRYIDGQPTTESVDHAVASIEGGEPLVIVALEEAYRPFLVPDHVAELTLPASPSPFADVEFWGNDPINYEAEVRSLDRGIGKLLQAMRDRGVYDKSWIVVVSDARECFKRWHETPNVPLLIKPPNSHEGRVDGEPMHVSQIYALLAEIGAGSINSELAPSNWTIANAPKKPRLIATIGDSLAAGYGSNGGGSYLDHLGKMLGCKTINLAQQGMTSVQATEKLDQVPGDVDVVIITLGSADVLKYVTKDQTLDALGTMMDTLQNAGAIVVYAVVDPLVIRNEAWSNEVRNLCEAKGVIFVPDVMDGIWNQPKLMSGDSLHPNGHGYRMIAERIHDQLRPHLE